MRRFFVAVLVLSIVVILALWAVVHHRNQTSYNMALIDQRATWVIKVNVGALTREIGWNAFWNPSFYTDAESNEVMDKKKVTKTGLRSPANVFLFQLEDEAIWSNTTFGVLNIDDETVLAKFLQAELQLSTGQDEQGRYAKGERVLVRYDDTHVVFALSSLSHKEDKANEMIVMDQLGDYLNGTHLVGVKDSRHSEVLDQSGHLVAMGTEQISVDFLEGEIAFSYTRDRALSDPQPTGASSTTDSSFVRLHGNITEWIPSGKTFSVGDYSLHSDSLRQYVSDIVVAEWKGMTTQTDSVVVWEYDENFEMREVVEIVERATPDFYVSVQGETAKLKHYLQHQGVLDTNSGEVDNAFFPLFRVFWEQEDGWLTLRTQPAGDEDAKEVETIDTGFYLSANIDAIKEHTSMPKIARYIAPFSAVVLESDNVPEGTTLRGTIAMEEKTVNSLMQLLVRRSE